MKPDFALRIRPFVFACTVSAILVLPSTSLGQHYAVIDLGSLGGPMAGGFGVNANTIVVGYSARPDANFHGMLWDGIVHDLLPLAGDTQSHAMAINALNATVGVSYILGGLTQHAMLWQAGTTTHIGDFAARGVNDAGTVVGCASAAVTSRGWVDIACAYHNGVLTPLGTLGGDFSYALDVNGAEQVVGMAFTTGNNTRRACLWQNGQTVDLGTLGGANSQAYAINPAGQVVGVSDTGAGLPHAFLYAVNTQGQVTSRLDLGELGGGYSYAYGINSAGEVVGTSNSRAFHWDQGFLVDLTKRIPVESGWVLSSAVSINVQGQITGSGFYRGWPHAFLLTPTFPDYDGDGDVDQADFGHFQACYGGSEQVQADPSCWNTLLDGDDAVDSNDFAIFQACASGSGIPADPNCWR